MMLFRVYRYIHCNDLAGVEIRINALDAYYIVRNGVYIGNVFDREEFAAFLFQHWRGARHPVESGA